MRRATQSSNEEQGEFRPNLAGQKRPQIEIAEGHKKKVAVQKGLCGPPPGHPVLLTLDFAKKCCHFAHLPLYELSTTFVGGSEVGVSRAFEGSYSFFETIQNELREKRVFS